MWSVKLSVKTTYFSEKLPTGAAWGYRSGRIGHHEAVFEFPVTLANRFDCGSSLGADRQSIGSVLHIAAWDEWMVELISQLYRLILLAEKLCCPQTALALTCKCCSILGHKNRGNRKIAINAVGFFQHFCTQINHFLYISRVWIGSHCGEIFELDRKLVWLNLDCSIIGASRRLRSISTQTKANFWGGSSNMEPHDRWRGPIRMFWRARRVLLACQNTAWSRI